MGKKAKVVEVEQNEELDEMEGEEAVEVPKAEARTVMHKVMVEPGPSEKDAILRAMVAIIDDIDREEAAKKAVAKASADRIAGLESRLREERHRVEGEERLVECWPIIDRAAREYREEAVRDQYGYAEGDVLFSRPLRPDELQVPLPLECDPEPEPKDEVVTRDVTPRPQTEMEKRLEEAREAMERR